MKVTSTGLSSLTVVMFWMAGITGMFKGIDISQKVRKEMDTLENEYKHKEWEVQFRKEMNLSQTLK